jgi:type VI protein secretion system component VasK
VTVFVLADFSFGELILTLFWIFILAIWLWLLIVIFGDLWRREDVSGWGKAAWLIFIVLLPLLGVLVYMIARPKPTEEEIREAERKAREEAGVSNAEELAALADLHDRGKLTDDEFAAEKKRLLG